MQQIEDIAREIFSQVRTTIVLNMRFMDMAVFRLKPTPAGTSLATDGHYLYYHPVWLLKRYRAEANAVNRDYLHVLLHCVFRHPFVHTLVDQPLWSLACDIAVESLICELNQPNFHTAAEVKRRAVVDGLRKVVTPLTAEKLYHHFQTHAPEPWWAALFHADEHDLWYNPARARQMSERARNPQNSQRNPQNSRPQNQNQPQNDGEQSQKNQQPSSDSGQNPPQSQQQGNNGQNPQNQQRDDSGQNAQNQQSSNNSGQNPQNQQSSNNSGQNPQNQQQGDSGQNSQNQHPSNSGQNPQNQQSSNSGAHDQSGGSGQQRFDPTGAPGSSRQGDGEQRQNSPNDGDSWPDASGGETTRQALEDEWRDISEHVQMDLETFAKERGVQAGGMEQMLSELNRERYNYEAFLKKFAVYGEVMKINDDEFDYIFYTYGLKLFKNMPLIEPLEYKEVRRVREFVIAIDTSGSTSGELVNRFLTKTYNILMSTESFFSKVNIHIVQCDARIQEVVKITRREEFEDYLQHMTIRGLGGTDFRPVFAYVDQLVRQKAFQHLKGLIYFTDGCGTFPERKPAYQSAFVFVQDAYNNLNVPPWAIKLILEKDEI